MLKDDPGIAELLQKALETWKAEHKLLIVKELQVKKTDCVFEDPIETEYVEWIHLECVKKHQVK